MLIEPQKLTAMHDRLEKAHNASTHNFPLETSRNLIELAAAALFETLTIYETYAGDDLKDPG